MIQRNPSLVNTRAAHLTLYGLEGQIKGSDLSVFVRNDLTTLGMTLGKTVAVGGKLGESLERQGSFLVCFLFERNHYALSKRYDWHH